MKGVDELRAAFDAALDDDLNTAGALDPMGGLFARANSSATRRRSPRRTSPTPPRPSTTWRR